MQWVPPQNNYCSRDSLLDIDTHVRRASVYFFTRINMNDDGSFNLHGPKMEFPEEVSQGIHQLLSQWLQTSSFQILPDDTFTPSSNNSLSLTTDRQRMEPVIFSTTNYSD